MLRLPSTKFSMKANLIQNQINWILKQEDFFKQKNIENSGNPKFILHDGPPYANGDIHIGHMVNKLLKDFVVRDKLNLGYVVDYNFTWDCHGLPIELEVLKTTSKTDSNFIKNCNNFANSQVKIQIKSLKKLGLAVDFSTKLQTNLPAVKTKIKEGFQLIKNSGAVYSKDKPTHWCTSCESSLAASELEYKDKETETVYVKFKVAGTLFPHYFVAYTTTLWTIPSNVALAYNPQLIYYQFFHAKNNEHYIAHNLPEDIKKDCVLISEYNLENNKYVSLHNKNFFKLLPANFVTNDVGTGIVHIAPDHGLTDFELASKHNIICRKLVNPAGFYTHLPWNIFDTSVLKVLYKDQILYTETIQHSYPHCWRHKVPSIMLATPQTFIEISDNLKSNISLALDSVYFNKESNRQKLKNMIETRPDWCISRQRQLGVNFDDTSQVLDVWFDSGISHYSMLDNQVADLYLEGSDQFRGWFNSSAITSMLINNRLPYKGIYSHGFVVDSFGKKMSKSEGNVVTVKQITAQYGLDVIKTWLLETDTYSEIKYSKTQLEAAGLTYKTIRNFLKYLLSVTKQCEVNYSQVDFKDIDSNILFKLQEIISSSKLDNYDFQKRFKDIKDFISYCSSEYLDKIKTILYVRDDKSYTDCIFVLNIILNEILYLLTPFLPYTVDEVKDHIDYSLLNIKDLKNKNFKPYSLLYFSIKDVLPLNLYLKAINLELNSSGIYFKSDLDLFSLELYLKVNSVKYKSIRSKDYYYYLTDNLECSNCREFKINPQVVTFCPYCRETYE